MPEKGEAGLSFQLQHRLTEPQDVVKPMGDNGLQHVQIQLIVFMNGSVEKSRQRRSRHFSVLTYSAYAPRVKTAAALLDGFF